MKTYTERPEPPKQVIAEQVHFDGSLRSAKSIDGKPAWEIKFNTNDYLLWVVAGNMERPACLSDFENPPEVLSAEDFTAKYSTDDDFTGYKIPGNSDTLAAHANRVADMARAAKLLQVLHTPILKVRL